jgi:DNA-binding transcriptional regulator GbsR (MarR family)
MRAKTKYSTQHPPELEELASQVGEFIQYWGFKQVHGRIWTHLFLSDHPLDAGDLGKRLKISKALVSMSIADLMEYDVIQEVGRGDQGTTLYRANPDQTKVIFNVLRRRERRLLSSVKAAWQQLVKSPGGGGAGVGVDAKELTRLGEWIDSAQELLDVMISLDDDEVDLAERFQELSRQTASISRGGSQRSED